MPTRFIARGSNAWGRGKTREEAEREIRKYNGGKIPAKYEIYEITYSEGDIPIPCVDSFGDIHYPPNGTVKLVKSMHD